jgi:glucan-binding YG repeat protein
MNSSGVMTTGWQKIGGKWYYMNSSRQIVTGTQVIGGKTYVFNSSGVWIK